MPNSLDVEEYVDDVEYPASRQTIVGHALEQGADEMIIDALNVIPDLIYEDASEVGAAVDRLL